MALNLHNYSIIDNKRTPFIPTNRVDSEAAVPVNGEDEQASNEEPKNPYRFRIIILFALLGLLFFSLQRYEKKKVIKFIPKDYLEPCNVTDILPLLEMYIFRTQMLDIEKQINNTWKDYHYDMPENVKNQLIQNRIKLKSELNDIKPYYLPQKEIRLKCFKENLWPLACGEFDLYVNGHFGIALLLLSISVRYMILARSKHHVSYKEIILSFCQVGIFFVYGVQLAIYFYEYYISCEVGERYLKKFPL